MQSLTPWLTVCEKSFANVPKKMTPIDVCCDESELCVSLSEKESEKKESDNKHA